MSVESIIADLRVRAEKGEAFKTFVHKCLDDACVPVDPPGKHRDAGCRIGQRLYWLFGEISVMLHELRAARARITSLQASLGELAEMASKLRDPGMDIGRAYDGLINLEAYAIGSLAEAPSADALIRKLDDAGIWKKP